MANYQQQPSAPQYPQTPQYQQYPQGGQYQQAGAYPQGEAYPQAPQYDDTSASTQMFKAFVDEPKQQAVTAAMPNETRRTGMIALGVVVALAVLVGVVILAVK
jgi:hypothetical protein